ncbi:MAG: DUF2156 domain-containing protein [Candidatus Glassbacteria bacterium]
MKDFEVGRDIDPGEDEIIFCCRVREECTDAMPLPTHEFSLITVDEKPLFEKYLRTNREMPSDLTFTNLFIWRKHYSYCYLLKNGILIIAGNHHGRGFYLEPLGEDVDADTVYDILSSGSGTPLERVSESFYNSHLADDDRFHAQELREHWDYIYSRESLAYLKGRRYHRKRNHVSRFMQNYRFDYQRLNEGLIDLCRDIMDEWCRERHCDTDPELCAEKEAVLELLDHYSRLELIGGLVSVDGKPVAFTVAEAMDDQTAVIHVEKAVAGFTGLYQAINKLFCERELEGFRLVNREQDLGIEGLRRAKENYFPVKMLKKYRVTLRT